MHYRVAKKTAPLKLGAELRWDCQIWKENKIFNKSVTV